MTYIKKEYRNILEKADKDFTIPKSFQRFIKEKEITHNLIIKSKGNKCYCTNCNYEFISKKKVNEEIKCPNCKTKLLIKSDRLQRYIFRDNLQLLDKVNDLYILRTFELYSSYNEYKTEHITTEFMRTIIKGNEVKDFVTNQVSNHMGCMYISHWQKFTNWKARNYRWAYRDVVGMVCPYNLKQLLKDTDLKYSQLDKFMLKLSKQYYVDFIDYFTSKAYYPSFEFLVKLKLYKLASSADKFYEGKSFKEIIGLPKTFYPFIKKHNLDYRQLEVLRLLQKEDIKLINKLVKYNNLEQLSRYVDLEKAYKYVLSIKNNREHEYLDYLRACTQLGYDMKSKKILYPSNLQQEHDRVHDLLVMVENEANDRLIKERAKLLSSNIYKNNKYIVYPASSVESLIEESKQQSNCVKTYCSRYALGECDIYFMRKLDEQDSSLVTLEVRNGKVVQSRIKNNENPTPEQKKFIDKWEQRILVAT